MAKFLLPRRRGVSMMATLTVGALALTGCGSAESNGGDAADAEGLTVYATTGYIADAVSQVAPNAEIITMVGPGGDPHTYQPSTQDIEQMRDADVVLWNGLYLEAQMIDQLESLGDSQLAVAEQLPEDMLLEWPETDDEGNELRDPHVWNSPEAWSLVIGYIADKLGTLDPDNAAEYQSNAEEYQSEIEAAAEEAHEKMEAVEDGATLITGHDAFNYLGETFDLEVYATDFVSTESALSAQELSELADMIAEREIPVIFQDNQANPQAITSLQEAVQSRDWDVAVSDEELYADSLGSEEGVDTYLGVFEHNTSAIADALSE